MIKLRDILKEIINAADAHRDESAVQTVIDGRRNLGFITLSSTTMPEETFWDLVEKHKLGTLEVPSNPHGAIIYFRAGAEKEARELRDIAEKYDGYLAYDATDEDSRRIGELLGYRTEDVEAYIEKNKKLRANIDKV